MTTGTDPVAEAYQRLSDLALNEVDADFRDLVEGFHRDLRPLNVDLVQLQIMRHLGRIAELLESSPHLGRSGDGGDNRQE